MARKSGVRHSMNQYNENDASAGYGDAVKNTVEDLVQHHRTHQRRPHRPSTGLVAYGFRWGFARGAVNVLREIWPELDDAARARAAELVTRYQREAA
ncbi:hypothetical protein [Mycobacterium sp. ITM-2016-00318]|uniref:hypothetical protein n=1 Tax=Mycobacterium sp. ITM-2016-00318 TaxID=2099693 RepID=UPI00130487EA|nr:hypothetical protein [Mycobacterium sp. ITM-2016-00318]WNG95297.1 hypothetical protein C6A82_013195 [Mycobacterium sp. ITM-2016-00318]